MSKTASKMKDGLVKKSVVLTGEQWPLVEARVKAQPDVSFSSYIRALIRADLAAANGKKGRAA